MMTSCCARRFAYRPTCFALRHRQEGQGLVEYGLIIASIAILLIIAMLFLAGKIDNLFSETGTSVAEPGPLPSVGRTTYGRTLRPSGRVRYPATGVRRPGYPLDRAGARICLGFTLSQSDEEGHNEGEHESGSGIGHEAGTHVRVATRR